MQKKLRHAVEDGRKSMLETDEKPRQNLWTRAFRYALPALAAGALMGTAASARAQDAPEARPAAAASNVNNGASDNESKVNPMAGPVTRSNVVLPEKKEDVLSKLLTKQQLSSLPAADAPKLAVYSVRLAEIIDLVKGSRPSSGANRTLYDTAIRVLGEGNKDIVLDKLTKAHSETFQALFALIQRGGDVGPYGANLNRYMIEITKGIADGIDIYANYAGAQTAIAGIRGKTMNLRLLAVPTPTTVTVGSNPVQNLSVHLRDIGPVRLFTREGQLEANAVVGGPGSEAILMFGETQANYPNAQSFADAYLNAWSLKDSTDRQGRANAGDRLANALQNITNTNITDNQNFKEALTLLREGDLKGAFEKLSGITTLGAAITSLDGRVHTVSVRNKALAVARGGVTAELVFRKNWEAFQRDILDGTNWSQPRVLAVLVGVYYEYLAMAGLYQQYQFQSGQPTLLSSERVKGAGHAVGTTPQLVAGTSYKGNPLTFTFYCDFGYRQYKVGRTVETPAGPKWVGASQNTAYLGAWGVQIDRLPGRRGVSPVRISSIGLGSVGDAKNPFYHMVTEFNYGRRTSRFNITTELNTQYAYWLRTHQVQLGLVPAKMNINIGNGINLTLGPEFIANTILGNRGQVLGYELTGAGSVGLNIERERADVSISARVGYQYGRATQGDQIVSPSSPFGGLQITITPRTKQLGRR